MMFESSDLLLDDIVLSDFDDSTEEWQHLINLDCALALSVCKSRKLPPCVFVLSLLYMKRLRALPSALSLTKIDQLTTKELYLIATLLADKYLIDEGEDDQLFNSDLTELTGIKCERINLIERQVLNALNWNLHVSNEEFQQFFHLFKDQIIRKDSSPSNIDSRQFYDLCFQYLGKLIEYLTLTSIVLLGSTISILTAVHLATLTHATLMKTLNPSNNCSNLDLSQINNTTLDKTFSTYRWSQTKEPFNETTELYPFQYSSSLHFPSTFSCDFVSCSIDVRPLIATIG